MKPTLCRHVFVVLALSQILLSVASAQSVIREIVAPVPDTGFGAPVAGLGDLNGDGYPELLVGSNREKNLAGAARIFSGADGSLLRTHTGAPESGFGSALNPAGDVNGDSFTDYVIGAPYAAEETGGVGVYSGKDGALLYAFVGDEEDDYFGLSVDGAGDVDQDGFADIIVGAPFYDPFGGGSGQGAFVRVFSGKDGSVLHNIAGNRPGDEVGYSVGGMGDLNGDGHDDFFATSPQAPLVRVYSGKDAHPLFEINDANASESIATSAGDVDGDGLNDLLVNLRLGRFSLIALYSCKDGSAIYSYQQNDSYEPIKLAGGGDVNGDGRDDFLIATLSLGFDPPGKVDLMSGRSGLPMYEFRSNVLDDFFGAAVAEVGDVDRDGRPDICVGSPGFPQSTGKLVIYSGNDLFLLATPRTVKAADELVLDTREGQPGDPTAMAVVEVNGTPFFNPIFGFATLDATGGRCVSTSVPSGLAGLSFCLKSFALVGGALYTSDRECILVQ